MIHVPSFFIICLLDGEWGPEMEDRTVLDGLTFRHRFGDGHPCLFLFLFFSILMSGFSLAMEIFMLILGFLGYWGIDFVWLDERVVI